MHEKGKKKINDDNKHNETRKYDKIKYTTQLEITTKTMKNHLQPMLLAIWYLVYKCQSKYE